MCVLKQTYFFFVFRLVDIQAPPEIHNAAREVLNIGAPLLLPQLKERVDFLQIHLPLGCHLSQGQQMLLEIILESLENPIHIAELLGFNNVVDQQTDSNYTIKLMNTLVRSFSKNTVSKYLTI